MQENRVNKVSELSRLWKVIMGCVFLALIFFGNAPVFASEVFFNSSNQNSLFENESIPLPAELNSFSQNQTDSNFPDSVPVEPKDSDEEEKEEKEDTIDYDCKVVFRESENQYGSREKVQIEQFSQSLQNRKTIPFFILFRSWKSFLS